MSTSASFTIFERKEPVITMYSHWDGYPEGFPLEVMQWLSGIAITNGLHTNTENTANGVSCLAAQMIAKFKTEPGNIYIYNPNMRHRLCEDYIYYIFIDNDSIRITVIRSDGDENTTVFESAISDYIQKFKQ